MNCSRCCSKLPSWQQELSSCRSRRLSVSRQPTGLGHTGSGCTTTGASASLSSRLPPRLSCCGSHSETGDRNKHDLTDHHRFGPSHFILESQPDRLPLVLSHCIPPPPVLPYLRLRISLVSAVEGISFNRPREGRKMSPRRILLLLLCASAALFALAKPSHAVQRFWGNAAGGSFNLPANWQLGVVPGPSDSAYFSLGAFTYTVNFPTNISNTQLTINP